MKLTKFDAYRVKGNIMRQIKKRTYYNFMRVVRMIQNKGYDFDESVRVTERIFDQYESCPSGLSILQMASQIIQAQ